MMIAILSHFSTSMNDALYLMLSTEDSIIIDCHTEDSIVYLMIISTVYSIISTMRIALCLWVLSTKIALLLAAIYTEDSIVLTAIREDSIVYVIMWVLSTEENHYYWLPSILKIALYIWVLSTDEDSIILTMRIALCMWVLSTEIALLLTAIYTKDSIVYSDAIYWR